MTRRVMAWELEQHHRLLGAIRLHLDLACRATIDRDEIIDSAARGVLRIALHPKLEEFPAGVLLAVPGARLAPTRQQLWQNVVAPEQARFVIPYAIAASPARLGVGTALLDALLRRDCHALPGCPRVVSFASLTGLRAQVIAAVEGEADQPALNAPLRSANLGLGARGADSQLRRDELLCDELRSLLAAPRAPTQLPNRAAAWLRARAWQFAASSAFAAGNFLRSTGATLIGVSRCADRDDCDAMWIRAFFEHRR